jgi:hypothetical protein
MYVATDIFDHAFHIGKLEGNDGCGNCHQDTTQIKNRETARACVECHEDMIAADSLVSLPEGGMEGFAAGYMDAMHGLCITCHDWLLSENSQAYGPGFAECAHCHREIDADRFRQEKPYVISRAER